MIVLVEACHHGHAGAPGPAQHRGDRPARGLAGDVPQGDVDGRQRVHHRAGAAEAREALARRQVQRLLLVDRLAEIVRRDGIANGGEQRVLHRRAERQAFAVAHEPVACRDATEGEAHVGAHQRLRDAHGALGRRDPERDGFYAVDDHVLFSSS